MSSQIFRDDRDGREYRTITIGPLVWFAENLSFEIQGALPPNSDKGQVPVFGYLYTLDAAIAACPAGFRIPSDDDWQTLLAAVGGAGEAGGRIMAKEGWDGLNIAASDTAGFSAKGAGLYNESGVCNDFGFFAHFWTSTPAPFGEYISYYAFFNDRTLTRHPKSKDCALSLRCVRAP